MNSVYEETSLTPMRVARLSGYIDWASQPTMFKSYPRFAFRYSYGDIPELKVIELSRYITSTSDIAGKPYYRLNTPSAGNLHPIELYVQIRGIKGVISGIYHVDVKHESIVLIQEIESDGIESLVGLSTRFKGFLFVVSVVPFRSEWKYGERALRYCYLDAGHQAGAIMASASLFEQKATILSNVDACKLNEVMGFTPQESSCMALCVGEETSKPVEVISNGLMRVAPTDYWESRNRFSQYFAAYFYRFNTLTMESSIAHLSTISTRRSVRLFEDKVIAEQTYDYFMNRMKDLPSHLNAYLIVLGNGSEACGIYNKGRECLKEGDFSDKISHLLVDQAFLKKAAMVIVLTSEHFSPENLMMSGMFAHALHLESVEHKIGFTGIGAFYDEKLKRFLEIDDAILYVCALGEERS